MKKQITTAKKLILTTLVATTFNNLGFSNSSTIPNNTNPSTFATYKVDLEKKNYLKISNPFLDKSSPLYSSNTFNKTTLIPRAAESHDGIQISLNFGQLFYFKEFSYSPSEVGIELLKNIGFNFGVGLFAGYRLELIRFLSENVSATQIPIMLDGRYYVVGDRTGIFFNVMFGFNHMKYKDNSINISVSDNRFAWAIGYGFTFEHGFEWGMRFESIPYKGGSTNYFGFRVGYFIK